ncbi:hypothetical protein EV122DRAFT_221590, partial [Schizophyllum commune]
ATHHARYSFRHFSNQSHKAFAQQTQAKPPPGRNVAFREPIADPTHLYTPLPTDSQSGTPIGSPATTPFTPAIGGMLPLPGVTPTVGYAPTLAPPTPYPSTIPLSAQIAAPATSHMAPAPAQDTSAPPPPPRAPSPQPVAPPAPPPNARKAVPGGKPPVADAKGQSKSVFNVYTRDMLPCLPAKGIARDPQWKGASAEKINVLMPIDLADCWLILYNAQRLKEVHFWHVRGNDSGRKFPMLEVRSLESFCVYSNEAWLTNLLDSLRTEHLTRLEVYYAASCAPRFVHDENAFVRFFASASHLEINGTICISPNHPFYGLTSSRLEGELHECLGEFRPGANWKIPVRDTRLHETLP